MIESIVIEEILERYAEIARGEILKEFGIESCIGSTRITVEVMKKLKVPVKPLVTKLYATNIVMAKLIEEHGYPDPETLDRWVEEHGAHSIGLGYGPPTPDDPGWDGHLVAFVGGRYVVDAAVDQVERPEKNIHVPDVLVAHPESGFIVGKKPMIVWLPAAMLRYEVMVPPDLGYKDSPNWRKRYQTQPAVERILHQLRAKT